MKIVVPHALVLYLIINIFHPGVQLHLLCTSDQASKQFKLCTSCASNSATNSNGARKMKGRQELVKLRVSISITLFYRKRLRRYVIFSNFIATCCVAIDASLHQKTETHGGKLILSESSKK